MYPVPVAKVAAALGGARTLGFVPNTVSELAQAVAQGLPRGVVREIATVAAPGDAWAASRRTALLRVPSALVPREPNYLVNPLHPEAARIVIGAPEKIEWDARLFGVPAPPMRAP